MLSDRLNLLVYLAKSDLQRRHAGTAGGVAWALFQPLATIAVIWVALDFGLGMRALVGPGYGITLVTGLIAWLAFADAVGDATGAIARAPHLVKKMVFPVELLPLAAVLSSFTVHAALVVVLAAVLALLGALEPSGLWLLPPTMLLSAGLAAGLALTTAALNVMVRDTTTVVAFLMQLWFWLTPVIWPLSQVGEAWRGVVGLNPMAVVVEGYRSALTGAPFTLGMGAVLTAVASVAVICALGAGLFRLLRPSLADAL